MVEAKSFYGVTGAVALGVAFVGLAQSGALNALNGIRWYDYSIPQLIFMAIIVAIPAMVVMEIYLGVRKPEDFLKATSEAMAQVAGTTPKKAEQFMKDIAYKTVHVVKTGTGPTRNKYPSTLELRKKMRVNFAGVRQAAVLPVDGGLEGQYTPLIVTVGVPLDLTNVENRTNKTRIRNIITLLVLIGVVLFYLITLWLKGA